MIIILKWSLLLQVSFDESVKLEVLRFVDGLNNIQFISVLSDHQRDIFYREIDLLVVTSYSESDPMIVHEAMSWGVVVISRDVGVVKSIVKNNESGMVLHFSSIAEDFAKGMPNHQLVILDHEKGTAVISPR